VSESLPHDPFLETQDKKEQKKRFIALAHELSQRAEGFPFPGIDKTAFEALKAVDEKYPGYTTPVDEVVRKMTDGIRIVLGEDPESGNVFVLPLSSDDIGTDSVLPRHLDINPEMNESLRDLVRTQKIMFESAQQKLND
jgi:hypothetical protein